MWHFGKDALTSYSGEKFDIGWQDSLNVFHHIYLKEYEKNLKVRKEVQEYPDKPMEEVFTDKLKANDNGDKTSLWFLMIIKESIVDRHIVKKSRNTSLSEQFMLDSLLLL